MCKQSKYATLVAGNMATPVKEFWKNLALKTFKAIISRAARDCVFVYSNDKLTHGNIFEIFICRIKLTRTLVHVCKFVKET